MARLRVLVAALALCAVLGCEDEPTPNIADPSPSSSAESPSESESSPSPSLSAEDTVRDWVDAWNEALMSGNTRELQMLSAPDCRNCSNYVATINEVTNAGGEISGGEWSIVELESRAAGPDGVKVVVGMAVAAGATINAAGEDPVEFEADRRGVVYQVGRQGDTWLISAIDLLS